MRTLITTLSMALGLTAVVGTQAMADGLDDVYPRHVIVIGPVAPELPEPRRLTQLERTVYNQLVGRGLDVSEFDYLTLGQVAAIKTILSSDISDPVKEQRAEAILLHGSGLSVN